MMKPTKIVVYKTGWVATKPWYADVHWEDGSIWKWWQAGFTSKKKMIENINAAIPGEFEGVPIERGEDR